LIQALVGVLEFSFHLFCKIFYVFLTYFKYIYFTFSSNGVIGDFLSYQSCLSFFIWIVNLWQYWKFYFRFRNTELSEIRDIFYLCLYHSEYIKDFNNHLPSTYNRLKITKSDDTIHLFYVFFKWCHWWFPVLSELSFIFYLNSISIGLLNSIFRKLHINVNRMLALHKE
jgi:hypothetical protein